MYRIPKVLEPIAANTPLAKLFNQWFAALAPVERLTSPRHSKSYTRSTLQDLTTRLHRLHHLVGRAISLLEADAPLEKIATLFVEANLKKIGIGLHLREKNTLFVYAAKGESIGSPAGLSHLNQLTPNTYKAKSREISAFTPVQLQIEAALWLNQEADMQFYLMKDDEEGRKRLLTILRGLLGAPRYIPIAKKGQFPKAAPVGKKKPAALMGKKKPLAMTMG